MFLWQPKYSFRYLIYFLFFHCFPSAMNLLENIILNITKNKSSTNDLINYLTQTIAEKCGDEIDAAVARSSLQSRSISSSISTGNTNIEKRLMHRRLRSTVNYLENLTKFQKFKIHLIKEIENSIKQSSAENRTSTGFETLFSVDEFSEDDTLFLTNFSFSQSLRVSKVDNLDGIVGILVNPQIAVEQRFAELQKLLNISPLAICRSTSFKILLQHFQAIISNPLLYPEFLSLISSIANIRDFNSFCNIFEIFQQNSSFILTNSNITDSDKFKFVDLIKQMFECIPQICRRRSEDEITQVMNIFVKFFVDSEYLAENKFLIIYGCIDANCSKIEAILHYHNLRKSIYKQWQKFLITVIQNLPKIKKENLPSFTFIHQNSVWSLYRAFLSTAILISFKYLPFEEWQKLEINDFLIWLMKIAFIKKTSIGIEKPNFVVYLRKTLFKTAQNQSFADIVIKSLHTTDPSNIPLSVHFTKFLIICLESSPLKPPTITIPLIQSLLSSKQRSTLFTAFQILDKLCTSNFDMNQIQTLLFTTNIQQLLLNNLHPMNPIHSNILFKSCLSNSKTFWRQFRPRSILNSPGIKHIQHYFFLSPEDKIVSLKMLTTFLLENESEKCESGLSFLEEEENKSKIQLPSALKVMIEFPGVLIEILKNFDLGLFFEENFNKSLQNSNGEFLRRMALIMKNIDFAIECSKILNLQTKIVMHFQQYFSQFNQHKCVIDDFIVGCFDILKAATMGHESELLNFKSFDFQKIKISEIAKKGCYVNREKILPATIKWIPKPIDNFEILCQILNEYRSSDQQQPPFAEMIKQILQNSMATDISIIKTSSPTTSSTTFSAWISSISNYAIFHGKTSSRQFTHRQSLLLKIPFYDFESGGKDWFMAAIFLAEKCNAKKTSEILSTICSSSIIDIRSFWAAAHESHKEFIDYLASDLWPIICKSHVVGIEKPRFGTFVNFVYRAGIGLMDFKDVEEYILIAILGGKIAVIAYFISYWNQLKMASNERLNINKILQCYLKIQDDTKKL